MINVIAGALLCPKLLKNDRLNSRKVLFFWPQNIKDSVTPRVNPLMTFLSNFWTLAVWAGIRAGCFLSYKAGTEYVSSLGNTMSAANSDADLVWNAVPSPGL